MFLQSHSASHAAVVQQITIICCHSFVRCSSVCVWCSSGVKVVGAITWRLHREQATRKLPSRKVLPCQRQPLQERHFSEAVDHAVAADVVSQVLGKWPELRIFFVFSFPVVPGPSSMYCTESEHSRRHLNSANLSPQQLVFDSFLSFFVIDVTAHCHQQCPSPQIANSATPICCNRLFLWGRWLDFSECVIVIVIVTISAEMITVTGLLFSN